MSASIYAGFWLRFVAFVIDSIVLSVIYLLLLIPLFGFLVPTHYEEFREMESGRMISVSASHTIGSLFGYAEFVLLIIGTLYYAFLESSRYQATIGKLILEMEVTDDEGGRLSFSKAFLRNVSKVISSIILMFGYVMAGLTAKKQALHDIIAHTIVVKK